MSKTKRLVLKSVESSIILTKYRWNWSYISQLILKFCCLSAIREQNARATYGALGITEFNLMLHVTGTDVGRGQPQGRRKHENREEAFTCIPSSCLSTHVRYFLVA